jgi:hypothetical protein
MCIFRKVSIWRINASNIYETKSEAGGELMSNNMFGAMALTFSDIRRLRYCPLRYKKNR